MSFSGSALDPAALDERIHKLEAGLLIRGRGLAIGDDALGDSNWWPSLLLGECADGPPLPSLPAMWPSLWSQYSHHQSYNVAIV